jgi:hypothetical protein
MEQRDNTFVMELDEHPIVVLSDEQWDQVMRDGTYLGVPVYSKMSKATAIWIVQFVRMHRPMFIAGLCKLGSYAPSWSVVSLLKIQGTYARVHLERLTCDNCG